MPPVPAGLDSPARQRACPRRRAQAGSPRQHTNAIRWRASRVLKPYLGFLATQPQPFTNTDIPFDALSDVQEGVIALKRTDPGVPQFTVLDVAPLFKDGRGLMRIELVGMDGDKEVVSASRFLLVTDLGMIVKKNADGSRDVFVCSLSEGNPISGAAVHI
ncbi:MAG: hypothetical protein ACLT2T_14085, partial [Bilophila wadsworthia]